MVSREGPSVLHRGQCGFAFIRSSRSKGSAASSEPVLGKGSLAGFSALLCRSETVLRLTELGQVECRDLLGLLDLLLVRLHLALHLVDEGLHPLVVFLVLIGSEGELLDLPLRLPHVLLSIAKPPRFSLQLRLKFTNAGFHLVDGLLSSLESVQLGLIAPSVSVLDLRLHHLPLPLQLDGSFLLHPQFISKTSSVNHGTLGLLLASPRLA